MSSTMQQAMPSTQSKCILEMSNMKRFSEAVLAKHKHMSHKASPFHAHSQGLEYTPSGKEVIRPIDTADAGYGGEAVSDAEGGEADAGIASKKAVSPMKMQTLVKKTTNEETERERLKRLRSFAYQQRLKGLGDDIHEPVYEEQIDELKKSTLASYAKKATDDVSYNSFMAGALSKKDPNRLVHDKRAFKRQVGIERAVNKLAKEEVEQVDELKQDTYHSYIKKAVSDIGKQTKQVGIHTARADKSKHSSAKQGNLEIAKDYQVKADKRAAGVGMAAKRVAKANADKRLDSMKKRDRSGDELAERNMENKAKKDNVTRQIGTAAYIQHGADAGSAKMTGRKVMSDPKMKSKKVADLYRKLPNIKEASSNGPEEENDMAITQLHFIKYAAEEIMDAIKVGTDMEEWYQNKLSKVHSDMESLYSYMQGTTRYHGTLGNPVAEGKMKDIATGKAEDERLAKLRAMAKKPQPKAAPVPRVGPMEKALEEQEVWDKPMPDSKKQGSLSPEQKAKAKARAERAGRSYPNMVDNMWASKQ
jgi:hypothetical protein